MSSIVGDAEALVRLQEHNLYSRGKMNEGMPVITNFRGMSSPEETKLWVQKLGQVACTNGKQA